jgi:hypothetical protein
MPRMWLHGELMNINDNQPIAIVGGTNTAKTNLMVYLARQVPQTRTRYILGYPRDIKGFVALNSIEDLAKISNCVLCIDELSRYFPPWEKKTNESLMRMLQFAQHNKIKVIMNTQLTQTITKQLEAFITQWAIKQIRMTTLKNGSTPKNILKYSIKHPNITPDLVRLALNEYVWYNENGVAGENGVKTFPDQHIGKDWSNEV